MTHLEVRMLALVLVLAGCTQSVSQLAEDDDARPTSASVAPALAPNDRSGDVPTVPGPEAPLAVLDYRPQGEAPAATEISVRFNAPVVALTTADKAAAAGSLLTLDPPVAGEAVWQSPDRLVFRPTGGLAEATRYHVRLATPIVGVSGAELTAPLEWTFETQRPAVQGCHPESNALMLPPNVPVFIEFNHPVDLKSLARHVSISHVPSSNPSATPRATPVRLRRVTEKEKKDRYYWYDVSETVAVAVPQTKLPLDSIITVKVGADAKGKRGDLTLGQQWSSSFRTYPPLRFVSGTCSPADQCEAQPIELNFSTPVTQKQASKITVSPRPASLDISVYDFSQEFSQVTIHGEFDPATTYVATLPGGLVDVFGQRLGKTVKHEFRYEHPDPMLAFDSRQGILQATRPRKIGVISRHVDRVKILVATVPEHALHDVVARGMDPSRVENLLVDDDKLQWFEREQQLEPKGKTNWSSIAVDLEELARGKQGPLLVVVKPLSLVDDFKDRDMPSDVRGLYYVSDLGLAVVGSAPRSVVRVASLATGEPVGEVDVWSWSSGPATLLGRTSKDGLLDAAGNTLADAKYFAVRSAGGGLTVVATPGYAGDTKGHPLRAGERLLGKVITERGVYRPGDKVHVVGWATLSTPYEEVGLRRIAGGKASFQLSDTRRRVVATAEATLDKSGKFWAELVVPIEAKLGGYGLQVTLEDKGKNLGTLSAGLKVEDYRVPEFKVEASSAVSDAAHGDPVKISVDASYYFGGPVHISQLRHRAPCRSITYHPPKLDKEWVTGVVPPYWDHGIGISSIQPSTPSPQNPERSGHLEFSVTAGGTLPYTNRCTAAASVSDASFQTVGAEAGFTVHPGTFYIAVKQPTARLVEGDRYPLTVRAVDWQGQRIARSGIGVKVRRVSYEPVWLVKGARRFVDRWEEKRHAVTSCTISATATGDDALCALPPLKEGTYEVVGKAGGKVETQTSFWVAPKSWSFFLKDPPKNLEVHVLGKNLTVGDTATVAIRAPWETLPGVLLLERDGVRKAVTFRLDKGTAMVRLPVDETWVPGMHFLAVVSVPGTSKRPQLAEARAETMVSAAHRDLLVAVDAPSASGPGKTVTISVTVRDPQGRPTTRGNIALWAVDEAVLSLTDYRVPALGEFFLPTKQANTVLAHPYRSILEPYVPTLDDYLWGSLGTSGFGSGGGGGMGVGMGSSAAWAPDARSRFETTPLFVGNIVLDADGRATRDLKLPENLTTFRIIAVASASLASLETGPARFGVGEAWIQVGSPLVLRAALPRVLRPGDEAELAAIVNNSQGGAGTLTTTLEIEGESGAIELLTASRITQVVDEGGQIRFPFRIRAKRAGAPKFILKAMLEVDSKEPLYDGMELILPVKPEPTLIEHVAMYGTVDDDKAIAVPVLLPDNVLPSHGGVEISAASTLLTGLEDSVREVIQYPYGCVEQTSSRLIPIVALGQISKQYDLGVPDTDEFAKQGIQRILSMQTEDGGFGYWPGATSAHPYASAYATWVLSMAKSAGYAVSSEALNAAFAYLSKELANLDRDYPESWLYYHDIRNAIAVFTLAEADRQPPADVLDLLFERRRALPTFAQAFLMMAMVKVGDSRSAEITNTLLNAISEQTDTAHVNDVARFGLETYFHSDGRSTAIALMGLMRSNPTHPVVTKLAKGLLAARRGGVWRNTQENAYALVALAEYAKTYEKDTPNFRGRAWFDDTPILDVSFVGRTRDTKRGSLTMQQVLDSRPSDADSHDVTAVTFLKKGPGRMYYRLGMEYAPLGDLAPISRGLTLERNLRRRAPTGDKVLVAGETVAIDINLTTTARTQYVAIDIPIPAGLEAINMNLGGPKVLPISGLRGPWVSFEEMRPDRVVVFADDLFPGTHQHTVFLRATTPGSYAIPPAVAKAMYAPEVFGRTDALHVDVRTP